MSTHYIYRMDICENDLYHGAYIGQHKIGSKDPSCDGYKGSGCRWKREILSNHIPVTKTILRLCDDVKEANFWEKFYIDQAKQSGEYLWNVVNGGGGYDHDKKYTEEELRLHNKARCECWYKSNKERHAEYGRQYWKNNKDRLSAAKRKHQEEYKEFYAEYQKQYYKDHIDELSEKHRQYYEHNKDDLKKKHREYGKCYRDVNAEKLATKAKSYNDSHKEERQKYWSRKCCYDGEIMTIRALALRLMRKQIPNPMQVAKQYLITKENEL